MLLQSVFTLMPMFVALFWAVLFLLERKRSRHQTVLTALMLVAVVNYLAHASFFLFSYRFFAFIDNLWVFTSLASYPLYYYYIRMLTKDEHFSLRWGWILLPALLLSLFSFVLYFAMSEQEVYTFVHRFMYHEPGSEPFSPLVRLQILRTHIFKGVFVVQVVLVLVFGLRLISRYNKRLVHFYSDLQGKDLKVFRTLLWAFLFASSVSVLSGLIGKDFFVNKGILLAVPGITHALFLYAIAYAGFKQRFSILDFNRDIQEYRLQQAALKAKQNQEEKENQDHHWAQELQRLITHEHIFTQPNLKISDLALRLGTNRTYISRAINEEMQTDFCSWINSYRVHYAQELMTQSPEGVVSMDTVAEQSGFSNLTSFYRAFKKHAKMTPGDYMRNLKEQP